MTAISVVTVGDTGTGVIDELERARGPVTVVRRCPELAALLAACQSGLARAAVVASGSDGLSATLVDRLAAVGVAVVALAEGGDEERRLSSIGAVAGRTDTTAAQLAVMIGQAVAARAHSSHGGYSHMQNPTAANGSHAGQKIGHEAAKQNDDDGTRLAGPASSDAVAGVGNAADGGPTHGGVYGTVRDANPGPGGGPTQEPGSGEDHSGAANESKRHDSRRRNHTDSAFDSRPDAAGMSEDGTGGKRGPGTNGIPRGGAAAEVAGKTGFLGRLGMGRGRTARAARDESRTQAAGAAADDGRTDTGEGRVRAAGGPGRVLAIWGPIGSPGRTTLALNMAAELAAAGQTVLVVDADTYGSTMAAALGLLDEAASLAHACRVGDQGLLNGAELRRIATEVVFSGGTFRLLTGLTRADRWPEVRAAALERVLAAGRELADVVVVDCGFCVENDEELSYDTVAPRRSAAALCALNAADTIYAVGSADTVGMPRLIRAMNEVTAANPGADVRVLLNKVRKTATGQSPAKALEQAWQRFGPDQQIAHFLPWDSDVTDKALLQGRLLMEVAPDSALRRAIAAVVCAPVQRNRRTAVGITTAGR